MLVRRLAAFVTVLTLVVGNAALCAGWEATPEARMACCLSGARCPMHSSGTVAGEGTRVITQAAADRCCAGASDSRPSSTVDSILTLPAALSVSAGVVVPAPTLALQQWRVFALRPVPRLSTHLRLSVLLI